MNDYNFGNFLCMLRERKGMTQSDIANLLGVTPAAVSKWENGSSKPRTEVLFRLAEILGVRSEELMAGHFIESETLNPEIIKEINARYEYLRVVDSAKTGGARIRRIIAWIIDWNIIGLITISLLFFVLAFASYGNELSPAFTVLSIIIMFMYPAGFMFRDYIFGGRSLGKRIMKLLVIDKQTGLPATPNRCSLRNLFLPIAHIDLIILLVNGSTIGDMVAKTVVISKKTLQKEELTEKENIARINNYTTPKPINVKKVIGFIALGFTLFIALFLSIIMISLGQVKKTEQYQLAYSYLIESEEFKVSGVEESKLRLNSYSAETSGGITIAEFQFSAKADKYYSFTVVCRKENGEWYCVGLPSYLKTVET